MEFLVEFEVNVPEGTSEAEVENRQRAETAAAAGLADAGHLLRVWKRSVTPADSTVVGLYRADSETQLHALLEPLPLYRWMHISVTPLESHPNDPAAAVDQQAAADTIQP